MTILSAKFLCSNTKIDLLPTPNLPEYAFVGRSNVGKSSLINKLTGKKGLAKTSSTPGKTQLMNHFLINESWYLVDLPGYGYAKVSKKQRRSFGEMIMDYIINRENLMVVFILVDSRHEPQQIDLDFIYEMGSRGIPIGIVFTKFDKLNKAQQTSNIEDYKQELLKSWEELPPLFITSSTSGEGIEEILTYIDECNGYFEK